MSTITANYIDPKLEAVRSAVARKSDEVPFLLLPVRVETRFMKVEKPLDIPSNTENNIEKIWKLLAESKTLLRQDLSQISKAEIKALLKEVNRKLKVCSQLVGKSVEVITKDQSQIIKEYTADIRSLLNNAVFKSYQSQTKTAKAHLNKIEQQLEGVKTPKDTTYQASKDYLQEMKALELRLLKVIEGKIPYTRAIHKKDLYGFSEKLFLDSEAFYASASAKAAGIQVVDGAQFSSIERVHTSIKELLPKANRSIAKVHQDKNWRAFIKKMDRGIKNLKPLFTRFEKDTLPKLEFTSEVDRVAGDKLYLQHLQVLEELTYLNLHPDQKLIQSQTKKLKKQVKKLARQNQKLIQTDATQYGYLQSIWKGLDTSLQTLNNRLTGKVKFSRRAKKLENPYFKRRLSIFPNPTDKGYTPELSLF